MYLTDAEFEMPLLHQMVPLASVYFEKSNSHGITLFSRSYVSNVSADDNKKEYILVQLFLYKCTLGPIYGLVVDTKDRSIQVRISL